MSTLLSCLAGVSGKVGAFMAMVGAGAGIMRVAMVASIFLDKSSLV